MFSSRLSTSITAHAWNKERSLIAICPNNNTIQIFSYSNGVFELQTTLTQHDAVVTSLAWAQNRNQIISCSQDRNAYVWRLEGDEWKPTLVLLRFNRAATCCAWSPCENKFAVSSGEKLVAICYFDKEYDWWASKHIKGFNSTVLNIKWHPNNVLLAATSSDNNLRVVSAFIKNIDSREDIKTEAWGIKLPFGKICKEIKSNSWVNAAAWNPDGNLIAWISHDSMIHVLECATSEHVQHSIKTTYLPFTCILWVSPTSFVVAGHDNIPYLFSFNKGINFVKCLDQMNNKKSNQSSSNASNWKKLDSFGSSDSSNITLPSLHQNCINVLSEFKSSNLNVTEFSSSGLDGMIAIWKVQ